MVQIYDSLRGQWALILGASSGFGGATAKRLAQSGMNICGVHLDRKATMAQVEEVKDAITATGRQAVFFNINAADPERRKEVVEALKERTLPGDGVRVFLHSLAFGTVKPYFGDKPAENMSKNQMEMTADVMSHSLVYWLQDLLEAKLLKHDARVFAMTSSGGSYVWPSYGAVSAAKASLESHIRHIAMELAPHGITANAIRAGVTETPALRKIPGHEKMVAWAKSQNPFKRLTDPKDVADAIAALSLAETRWITGNVIGVDGGEHIVG